MQMKRALLVTTAMLMAAGTQQAQASEDLYVNTFGGANFLEDDSGSAFNEPFSFDPDTGFIIGGAIGTHLENWVHGLELELEVSYRRNDVPGTISSDTAEVNVSNFAIMTNLWYEFNVGSKVRPYVGGGVGWDRVKFDAAWVCCSLDTGENNGFAWQLGAGFNYEVMHDVDVGLGYTYFRGPDFDDMIFGGKNLENRNHAIVAKLTIGID